MTALAGTVREWTHGDWRIEFEGRTKGQTAGGMMSTATASTSRKRLGGWRVSWRHSDRWRAPLC